MDVAAEKKLTRMIERRSIKGETNSDEREELWMECVRRFKERERREIRARWYSFHLNMSELHSSLAAEHKDKAEKLLCEEGD